ncbi:MAG: hypothetical protein PWQ60_2405 [Thermoanaerobacteraceae bacterium]|nr:hypothetical protein [Thermoanaerobacteraceae bacterium]MDN5311321.1 hypothetical protein [Thermoanaerobacteraceae bacterium]
MPVLVFMLTLSNSFLLNSVSGIPNTFLNTANSPDNSTTQVKSTEQKLIEEILALDSRVLALQNRLNELSAQNNELKKSLSQKRVELSRLDRDVRNRQKRLSRWIVFSFKGGMGNFLGVLVGAEDMGDFFRRLDNIVFIMEYYNNMIVETKSLIFRRKQEESEIMEKQNRIQELEQQAKKALEELKATIAEKQRELAHARMLLKDTAFLEKISENWQEALPSLDYLLKNLTALPWTGISPDDLKVNWFTLTARAEFKDTSLTQKLLSKDEKLKNVYFTFHQEGLTVSEKKPESSVPLYSITCSLELTEEQKIKFTPKSLEFNGVILPPEVIKELMKDYNMEFTPPPLPHDLKIASISTEEGKLIMYLKR